MKVVRYHIGDEITYQIAGDGNYWYNGVINDIYVEDGFVILRDQIVKIEDIKAIRSFKTARFSRMISNTAFSFDVAWILFSVGTIPFGNTLAVADAIIVGSTFIVGALIRTMFRQRTYRIGGKRRLRLLDLNFSYP